MAGVITILANNDACDGVGYRRFVFIKLCEGTAVAAGGRCAALQENQDRNYRELQEAIEHMSAKQNGLLAAM